jgi:hypothetical protein
MQNLSSSGRLIRTKLLLVSKIAQKQYYNFEIQLADQEYKNPLDEVTGSVLLGGQDFANFIKDHYLTGLKQSKDVPAVRALVKKVSIQGICHIVDQAMGTETKMAR